VAYITSSRARSRGPNRLAGSGAASNASTSATFSTSGRRRQIWGDCIDEATFFGTLPSTAKNLKSIRMAASSREMEPDDVLRSDLVEARFAAQGQVLHEVLEIGLVGADGVFRQPALDEQVIQEQADQLVHHGRSHVMLCPVRPRTYPITFQRAR